MAKRTVERPNSRLPEPDIESLPYISAGWMFNKSR